MAQQKFQITWDGGRIIYTPASGTIETPAAKSKIKIHKHPQSLFPDFSGITSDWLPEKFKPFCLTIYPNHHCNLACSYCYIPEKRELPIDNINFSMVQTAAEIVAHNCIDQHQPFTLGFHGGNEPLLDPELISRTIEICRKVSTQFRLNLLTYCTTNGVIRENAAHWAAQTFDGITLSWDGPANIHDRFRVKLNGTLTSSMVQRTAEILLNSANGPKQFKVRTTVTNKSVHRLPEIAQFFHRQNINWIEFYPVYQDFTRSLPKELMPQPAAFVKNFLIARQWANQHGMTIGYSGSRLADFHDQYCPVYQHNLTITPDGFLTACFLVTHNYKNRNNPYLYGQYDQKIDRIVFDWDKLNNMFQRLAQPHSQCKNCFNYWHCAKGCPAVCPLNSNSNDFDHYDCTIERWIGLANILEASGFEFSENQLHNCQDFFSGIQVEMINGENTNGPI